MLKSTNEPLCSPITVLLLFLAFTASIFIILIIRKIYYHIRWHKRYYIVPRIGIKGITNIAMTISLSIAIILLLTTVTSGLLGIVFRAYPGWRVTIEQFLIQLGGLLFGPIIGMIVGGLTDLLTIALTSGVFHYGFFLACLVYGLLAGLIKVIWDMVSKDTVKFNYYSMIIYGVLILSGFLFIWFQHYDYFVISIFSQDISFTKLSLIAIYCSVLIFGALFQWIILFIWKHRWSKYYMMKFQYNLKFGIIESLYKKILNVAKNKTKWAMKQAKWYAKKIDKLIVEKNKITQFHKQLKINYAKKKWVDYLIPVITLSLMSQAVVSFGMLPFFDISFSAFGYDYWLVLRTLLFPLLAIFDILIIYPAFYSISHLVKYDYKTDKIENLDLPFME